MTQNKKKVLVLTEMAFQGSGYYYLMSPILDELSKVYDVKVVGLSYDGTEHQFGFSIAQAETVKDAVSIAQAITQIWHPDIFICGLDIPLQITVHNSMKQLGVKYIAVTPLENPPLTPSWAASLMSMDYVFFISELGKKAALKAGMTKVDHLQVAANTKDFYPATDEERNTVRENLGIKDEFTVLTVADNQERKNLWAEFEIISRLKKDGKKVKFILVTRENSPVGYKLRDLAMEYGLNKELMIIERGIPSDQLRNLYIASDVYLSTSKAEGYGLPIVEAMACGLPVVATNTGAITELLQDGRGYLIKCEYEFRDPWGNELRRMIDIQHAYKTLTLLSEEDISVPRKFALEYVKTRTLDIPVKQIADKVEELTNG